MLLIKISFLISISHITNQKNIFLNPFEFMNSTHIKLIILEKSGKFVKSNIIFLGKRTKMSYRMDKNEILLKDENFQYHKIKQTLYVLLLSSNIRDCILNYNTETFFEPFKNSFSDFWQNKNILRLLLFYHEIEVKNPLGDIAVVYKLGMFNFFYIKPWRSSLLIA